MPVEMGDAATSIVGRLITLSGCLPQATGVIRPPFIPESGSLLDLPSSRAPRPAAESENGRADFKEATMRITRYFHVRWLNWNATGDLRRGRRFQTQTRRKLNTFFSS